MSLLVQDEVGRPIGAREPGLEAGADLRGRRWRGLDVLRGLTLVVLAVLVFTPTSGLRGHAAWWGLRPSDVIFPAFLFVAGAGLFLQTRRGYDWPRLGRRFVALLVLGLLVNSALGAGLDLAALRYPGVLQRIAVVGLAGALVSRLLDRRWRAVAAAAVGVLALWGVLLHLGAAGCPGGQPAPGCGTFVEIDEAVFGRSHLYRQGASGHDPEGLASSLGALATFLAGFAVAGLLTELDGSSVGRRVWLLLVAAAAWAALTPIALVAAPVGKRLWTPAFVTVTTAGVLLAWAALTWLFDHHRAPVERLLATVAWPFEAVGRNALVLWVGLFLIDAALLRTTSARGVSLRDQLLASQGTTWYLLVLGGGWLAVAMIMHAARWHIRL